MREDNFIHQSHLRNRFKTAGQTRDELNNIRIGNPISKMTVLRRLKEGGTFIKETGSTHQVESHKCTEQTSLGCKSCSLSSWCMG